MPLIPASMRPAASACAIGSLAVLSVLALLLEGTTAPGSVDSALARTATAWFGSIGSVLDVVDDAGDAGASVVLCAAIAAVLLAVGQRRLALLAMVGPAVAGAGVLVLKPVVARTLRGIPSFPSGHVTGIAAVTLVLALVALHCGRPDRRASPVVAGMVVMLAAVLMGVAVVVGGVHWPSDVLGGLCTAVSGVLGTALLLDTVAARRGRARRPDRHR